MREILFRGRRIDNGEWIEGDLAHSHGRTYCGFYFETISQVDPSTVGQYTGLEDRNGKRIFEGDIVKAVSYDYRGDMFHGEVVFKDGCWCIEYYDQYLKAYDIPASKRTHRFAEKVKWYDNGTSGPMTYTYTIIGNIHDNPELLEV